MGPESDSTRSGAAGAQESVPVPHSNAPRPQDDHDTTDVWMCEACRECSHMDRTSCYRCHQARTVGATVYVTDSGTCCVVLCCVPLTLCQSVRMWRCSGPHRINSGRRCEFLNAMDSDVCRVCSARRGSVTAAPVERSARAGPLAVVGRASQSVDLSLTHLLVSELPPDVKEEDISAGTPVRRGSVCVCV